jgi:phosphoribosyl-dephospho-CoA transferase
MNLKRHTLLDITDSGRDEILADLAGSGPGSDMLREMYAQVLLPEVAGIRVPGVVRREETALRSGYLPVGFSSPTTGTQGRLRMAAFVQQKDILRITSPYDLLTVAISPPRNACNTALALARSQARIFGLVLGVWGSAALELYTGLPCTHADSDLDLLVVAAPQELLCRFLLKIESIEEHLDLRIDVEIDLPNGYGVNLKELFGHGRTVLGKSFADVAMLSREQILAVLPQAGPAHVLSEEVRGAHG